MGINPGLELEELLAKPCLPESMSGSFACVLDQVEVSSEKEAEGTEKVLVISFLLFQASGTIIQTINRPRTDHEPLLSGLFALEGDNLSFCPLKSGFFDLDNSPDAAGQLTQKIILVRRLISTIIEASRYPRLHVEFAARSEKISVRT